MKKRQPNQYRILENENDLTEGAEKLLTLIEKYQYVYNVTNTQYSHLMGISRRNVIKYVNELEKKGRIQILPENRKRGRGLSNFYRIVDSFDAES